MKILEHISLLPHNTFGIDVQARRLVEFAPETDPLQALRQVVAGRWMMIGEGSNIVFTADYDGTLVRIVGGDIVTTAEADGSVLVAAGAGLKLDSVVEWCVEHGLYGMENLSAIPGTVGASAVQNVGAYGVEARDVIDRVEAIDLEAGERRVIPADDCRFGYRHSIFKEQPGRWIIVRVVYRLSPTYTPRLGYKALEGLPCSTATALRQAIATLRWQKLPRPEEHGSAGSFFKNPVVDGAVATRLQAAHPDMPLYGGNKLSAGWLIDQCGWKGRTLGRAGVWPRQALVLYNAGGCTGGEVLALSRAIQDDVERRFGIRLEPEAIIV